MLSGGDQQIGTVGQNICKWDSINVSLCILLIPNVWEKINMYLE